MVGSGTSLVVSDDTVATIGAQLIDTSLSIAARFRTVFTLRNIGGPAAVQALAKGTYLPSPSPL